ncbi:MAG: hypothetical protein DRQ98_10155 [Gammaproteobacteria bacterium]|nr:MAG: hypothetical protein DRQ98_10155 [Gammaproteobacteria bacterium]
MAFNWAATRKLVRTTVAETFGLDAQYRASDNSPSIPVRVRVHNKDVELEQDGFMRADQETWIWLLISEVPTPVVDASIYIESTGESFLVDRLKPGTDIAIPVVVRAA